MILENARIEPLNITDSAQFCDHNARLWGADIEWKIIYVGSAETEEHDQVATRPLDLRTMLLV